MLVQANYALKVGAVTLDGVERVPAPLLDLTKRLDIGKFRV
jgi:hypothetical protein